MVVDQAVQVVLYVPVGLRRLEPGIVKMLCLARTYTRASNTVLCI